MRDGHTSQILEALEGVVNILEEIDPAHAFVLGDLIEDCGSTAADRANVEHVHEILQDAPFSVTYLLGNHDVEQLTRESLSSLLDQEQFYGVIEVNGTPIIYLDSTIEQVDGARGRLGSDQRAWLAEMLTQYNKPLILIHHPLGNFDISDNEWFKNYPERAFLSDRKETLDILEEAGPVLGTISGHIHQTQFSKFREMPHVSINAFSKELPDKPLTGTFAEVRVGDRVNIDTKIRRDVITSHTSI